MTPDNKMKWLAEALICPHVWGPERKITLVDGTGKRKKPDNGTLATCKRCGTHSFKRPDGTGSLMSADALSGVPK